jgi:hypothetical protein
MNRNALISLSIGAVSLALLAARPVLAGEAEEVATANQHAGLALASPDIKMVHMHLQHVVNCLVGPKGIGFDAAPGNPCKDKGDGAIPDATSPAAKTALTDALAKAQMGIAAADIDGAKKAAADAKASIEHGSM